MQETEEEKSKLSRIEQKLFRGQRAAGEGEGEGAAEGEGGEAPAQGMDTD